MFVSRKYTYLVSLHPLKWMKMKRKTFGILYTECLNKSTIASYEKLHENATHFQYTT